MSPDARGIGRKDKQRLTRAQVWFYLAGYVVLAAGSAGSVWAYRRAVWDEVGDAVIASTYNTKKYQDQMERIGGKANILATDVQQWFAGLWHGRHLAYTLAVLTFAIALMCFYIAHFLPDLPPFDDGRTETRDGLRR